MRKRCVLALTGLLYLGAGQVFGCGQSWKVPVAMKSLPNGLKLSK